MMSTQEFLQSYELMELMKWLNSDLLIGIFEEMPLHM